MKKDNSKNTGIDAKELFNEFSKYVENPYPIKISKEIELLFNQLNSDLSNSNSTNPESESYPFLQRE